MDDPFIDIELLYPDYGQDDQAFMRMVRKNPVAWTSRRLVIRLSHIRSVCGDEVDLEGFGKMKVTPDVAKELSDLLINRSQIFRIRGQS